MHTLHEPPAFDSRQAFGLSLGSAGTNDPGSEGIEEGGLVAITHGGMGREKRALLFYGGIGGREEKAGGARRKQWKALDR